MADISNLLNQIKTAIKGEDVRGAIHDAIEQCYTDGNWNATTGMVDKLARDKISALYNASTGNVQETVLFDATGSSGVAPIYCPSSIPEFSVSPATFDYIYIYYKPVATAEPELHIYPVNTLAENSYKIVVTGIYPYDPGNDNSNKLLRVRRLNIQPINVSNLLNWECYAAVVWEWDGVASNAASNYNVDGASNEANTYPAGQIVKITGVKYQSIADAVESYMETHQFPSAGLTEEFKSALYILVNHVAFAENDPNGQSYIEALNNAMYPGTDITRITAVYTQSGTVYDSNSLYSLREDLVVTASYSDGTSGVVTGYALSGTLAAGTSTITVSYGGKTTTFTVTVTQAPSASSVIDGTSLSWEYGYIDDSGNVSTTQAATGTWSSDYFSVNGYSAYGIALDGSTVQRIAFYDLSRVFISRELTDTGDIPTGAYYARATISKGSLGTASYDGTGTTITLTRE